MGDNEAVEQQSFLSRLREHSAIIFTIGLAISVASFVENLHMGKDAIAYVVAELSKIEGWADAVKAVAAIFHGALEWWRGVLRDLLSFLPFQVPQWLHDPLSVIIFCAVRFQSGFRSLKVRLARTRVFGIPDRYLLPLRIMSAVRTSTVVAIPLLVLLIVDKSRYSTISPIEFGIYGSIVLGLFVAWAILAIAYRQLWGAANRMNVA